MIDFYYYVDVVPDLPVCVAARFLQGGRGGGTPHLKFASFVCPSSYCNASLLLLC